MDIAPKILKANLLKAVLDAAVIMRQNGKA
jgi:hypothetical protein